MKRFLVLFAIFAMAAATAARAQKNENTKSLVIYFSHSGNTRAVAEMIAEATGADIFEVVPVEPYPEDYRAVVDQAKKEIEAGYRPAIKSRPEHLDKYDVVFVGSPCWWATVAPPVATLLAGSDLKGKKVVPFMTHEGSRMGRSVEDIRKLCPGAEVTEGLAIRGSSAAEAGPAIRKWLETH